MRQYSVDKSECYKSKTLDLLQFLIPLLRLMNIEDRIKQPLLDDIRWKCH